MLLAIRGGKVIGSLLEGIVFEPPKEERERVKDRHMLRV